MEGGSCVNRFANRTLWDRADFSSRADLFPVRIFVSRADLFCRADLFAAQTSFPAQT